ncbi:uncharacterized protein L969DRAFT_23106 [Mixia osmundae IAM 14324]|uniref:Ca3427-like PBP 2 domain-containing protein n=1 Tax=Mixia osmundae (strain CBS 9802 / IAM 14324 / JCM 22182 / KY 12970) TaxID=764103 RepID=G7E9B1_MIXOS|nr:uncharacterized protein L969DRAFT_23106 [Mixia osmundae IAM 14324]KEI39857.1 hypothetical protein L969DRAFT_23106 [Mixia osmundae IAM 14324]GAA99230.1 hypothetical protein E5Q_05924 [Mixia osmundae IAM 14324]
MTFKVGFVPEQVSLPIYRLADADSSIELVECPGGTGEMIGRLNENEVDVAIALTESLIAGLATGKGRYKLVGSAVDSPLNWAVVTGKKSSYESIGDLRKTVIGISRVGSGSQVMANYMAWQQKWFSDAANETVEPIEFVVLNTFEALRNATNDGTISAFLWEWYTTKPYLDSGEVRFIGSVVTPWPSWTIARSLASQPEAVTSFLDNLSKHTREADSQASRDGPNVDYIVHKFGYNREDFVEWQKNVKYPHDTRIVKEGLIISVLDTLGRAGVVKDPSSGWHIEEFVDTKVANLISEL